MLESGLGQMSLRTLASVVGTSDRMLLYYFDDKSDLMLSAFECFVQRLSARLGAMLPAGRQPFDVLLKQMWTMLKAPDNEPYVRIWYEALGHASHGEELYRTMTNRVLDEWLAFFEPRLDAPAEQRRDQIAAIVAAACGLVMMSYIGRAEDADVAASVLSQKVRQSRGKREKPDPVARRAR